MAWATKKQYAILMSSEEGKDIAENLGEMSQDEFDKKFSELLGKSGQTIDKKPDNEEAKQKWLDENGYESEDEVPWWERDDSEEEFEDEKEELKMEVEDYANLEINNMNSGGAEMSPPAIVEKITDYLIDEVGFDEDFVFENEDLIIGIVKNALKRKK